MTLIICEQGRRMELKENAMYNSESKISYMILLQGRKHRQKTQRRIEGLP
jgi:hypothetical protein